MSKSTARAGHLIALTEQLALAEPVEQAERRQDEDRGDREDDEDQRRGSGRAPPPGRSSGEVGSR